MRKLILGLSITLCVSLIPALAANPPKAGAVCSKTGVTNTYQNKKFTCVKSGSKLIWNKGVVVKSTSNTAVSPSPTPTQTSPSTPKPTPSATAKNSTPRLQMQPCTELGAGLQDGDLYYRCGLQQSGKLQWRWQSGPFVKESDIYDGKECSMNFELLQVQDTIYRCLTSGTVDLRWGVLDIANSDLRTGTVCDKTGEKIVTEKGFLLCDPVYGTTRIWKFFASLPLPTKNAAKYKGVAAEGRSCDLSGDTFDIAGGYLECRYVNGGILKWIRLNTNRVWVNNPISPSGVELCRLKNSDVTPQSWRWPGSEAGFPVTARNGMFNPGANNVLIVGVDFPEHPGENSLKTRLAYNAKMVSDWFDFFSNKRVKFNIDTIDTWIRLPKAAKDYVDLDTDRLMLEQTNIDRNAAANAQPIVDEITKVTDLRKYSTVYVMLPTGEMDFTANLIFRNRLFKIKEGETHLNFFSWNADLENLREQQWWFDIHESLHDFPLPLHAPGNGWINERYTFALNSWSRFQMNWLLDDQVYCVDKKNLKTVDVALSPVEREDTKTKMATIKISPTKAIVVQAHGIDKWSNIDSMVYKFPAGFYGVVAYLVNLDDAGALNFGTDGRAITGDNGNDPKYPKWSYYMPIDGSRSFPREFFPEQTDKEYTKYIAGLGDTFKIEGVKIEFVKSGDYETVRISLGQ